MLALTTSPLWISALVVVGIPTVLAMLGPVLIRRWVALSRLRTNNEVAGFKFATVGVLYAVLLAFAVIVVWEKFAEAEDQAATEAGAAATLYRLASGIGGEAGAALRDATSAYIEAAIGADWPAMTRGEASPEATRALDAAYATLLEDRPADARDATVLAEALRQLDQLTEARRARIVSSSGIVPGLLWVVLLVGGFLTIGFTFFFGTENLKAQAAMTGALSVLIFSGILVIVAIDRPFAGSVRVLPEALVEVLADFGGRAAPDQR